VDSQPTKKNQNAKILKGALVVWWHNNKKKQKEGWSPRDAPWEMEPSVVQNISARPFWSRVSNSILGILVCDSTPRILEIEIPGIGSCSRSAKWAWDRSEGGCHRTIFQSRCRTLYLHPCLVRTNTGSESLLETPVPVLNVGSLCFGRGPDDPMPILKRLIPINVSGNQDWTLWKSNIGVQGNGLQLNNLKVAQWNFCDVVKIGLDGS